MINPSYMKYKYIRIFEKEENHMACTCGTNCTAACESGCGDSCMQHCGRDCSGSCSGSCSGTCSGTCKGGCTDTCKGGCSGCGSGCASECVGCTGECTGCTGSCDKWCTGCTGTCEGCDGCSDACARACANSCTGTCSSTCSGGCQTKCTGTCTGACNSGCYDSAQMGRYDSVSAWLDAAIIVDASKANTLKAFIEFELTRRGISLNTHEDAVSGQLAKGTWWDTLRTNLEKSGKDIVDTSTTGNVISKDAQSEFIKIAIELYNTVVGKA